MLESIDRTEIDQEFLQPKKGQQFDENDLLNSIGESNWANDNFVFSLPGVDLDKVDKIVDQIIR